jgi:multidrug efflux system membrane fusion protein
MGDDVKTAAAPAAPPTPAAPAGSRRGWLVAVGVIVVGAVAAGLAIRYQLVPVAFTGGLTSPARQTAEQKIVVRYVRAASLAASGLAPGSVYIAEIRGDNEINLSFEVGGVVDSIGPSAGLNWAPGAAVNRGSVLAELKKDDFINRITAAQARAELARVTYERMQNLLKTESIPKQKVDQAETEYKAAKADLAAAEQSLNDTVLRAPWDGAILERLVNPAETIGPGRPVLNFSSLKRMTVEVGVPDTVVSRLKVDQEASVQISALPGRSFRGLISQVAVKGEAATRLFKVKLKVPNPDGAIKSGMTASVSFARAGHAPAGAVWVPLAALTTESGASGKLAVYVVDNGKARKRPVQTDDIAGNQIMITEGLKADDQVVVVGVGTLYDGAAVDAQPLE